MKGTKIDFNLVLEEYRVLVDRMTHESVIANAYIKQLETTVEQLQKQLDDNIESEITVVESNK